MIDRKMNKKQRMEKEMQTKKERIIYHLINIEREQEQLKKRPYLLFEDMAIVFDLLGQDGLTIYKIDHKMAQEKGWEDNFLWEVAQENTRRLWNIKIEPVNKKIFGHTKDEPVFVLSNEIKRYGAGVVCYENVLRDFATKYGWNLYLIPTSIHEFIVLFDQGNYNCDHLLEILRQSNETLDFNQYLSDNIYYYDRHTGQFFGLF